jgi:hypothetical protein
MNKESEPPFGGKVSAGKCGLVFRLDFLFLFIKEKEK